MKLSLHNWASQPILVTLYWPQLLQIYDTIPHRQSPFLLYKIFWTFIWANEFYANLIKYFWLWKQGKYLQVLYTPKPLLKNKGIVLASEYFQIFIFTYTTEINLSHFCLFKHVKNMKYYHGDAPSRLQYRLYHSIWHFLNIKPIFMQIMHLHCWWYTFMVSTVGILGMVITLSRCIQDDRNNYIK